MCHGRGDLAVHQIIFPPDPATSSNQKLEEFLQLQTKIGHWYYEIPNQCNRIA